MVIKVEKFSDIPLNFVPIYYRTYYRIIGVDYFKYSRSEFVKCLDWLLETGEYRDFIFIKTKYNRKDTFFSQVEVDHYKIFEKVHEISKWGDEVKRSPLHKVFNKPKWDRGPEVIEVKPGKFREYKRLCIK